MQLSVATDTLCELLMHASAAKHTTVRVVTIDPDLDPNLDPKPNTNTNPDTGTDGDN